MYAYRCISTLPSLPDSIISRSIPDMCYYLLAYTEYGCGHQLLDRRNFVDCNRVTCRRSRFHNVDEHDCTNECTEEWSVGRC
ncbi:uncharacterized protein LAESUDRAFT_694558 [Laetiporus sulphureus 93-53]|uniref:Uncharacterized protein n=1 Tax=Laetiporus sulphureus 93-53 TaxID=1314785 RepID=A0A165G9A5_9APHY|nr:uncharacterized protein LAESUDRAFT_694558 [Laetiporus sulphureus 93-53]KZT10013.1 hypothetical protein LAESUDRAFT_694558 [Laetiporus sulphureus 93-53]